MKTLLQAVIKAQGELQSVPFNAENPHYRNRYANLAGVQEATRAVLLKHELCVIQEPGFDKETGHHTMTTTLAHSSGETRSCTMFLELSKKDMQGLGSAQTYAKRYALLAVLNISGAEDDDGEASIQRGPLPSKVVGAPKAHKKEPDLDEYLEKDPPNLPPRPAPATQTILDADNPGDYVVPMGYYKGKKLSDVGVHNANKTIDYFRKLNSDSGKAPTATLKQFERMLSLYVDSLNSKGTQKEPGGPPEGFLEEPMPEF